MAHSALFEEDFSTEARFNMVESQLKPGGVRDRRITELASKVAREFFVGSINKDIAYGDLELTCEAGGASRTLLTPLAFARLTELADITSDDVVLDIAGGTGYSGAVLAGLSSTVIALEDDEALSERASDIWRQLGIDNAVAVTGPLPEGQGKQGPFNVIFINGCVADIPGALLHQLVDGGRLVCAQIIDGSSKAVIYQRLGDSFARRVAFDVTVPSLESFRPVPEFKF